MRYVATIRGIRPVILHNGRTSDPLDEYAKKMKKISSIRSKTDEHHQQMSDIEFEAGLYWSDELGVYMPSDNLQSMLLKGAKKLKLGQKVVGALVDEEYGAPLDTPNARDLDALKADPSLRFRKGVSVNGSTVMRTRPMFPSGWSITFHLDIDESLIRVDEVQDILNVCGSGVGLGDWRPGAPKKPGTFGRFIVEKFEKVQ